MCKVHLVEEVSEIRIAVSDLICGEDCGSPILTGSQFRFIEGVLDDKSGQRHRYVAHDDCYIISESTDAGDGCFQYGQTEVVATVNRSTEIHHRNIERRGWRSAWEEANDCRLTEDDV
jgi:hypothetical protein